MQLEFFLLQLVTDIAMTKQTILTATMMDLTVAEILLIQNSALTVHAMVNSSLGTIHKQHCLECSAMGMGQFPICKLKWDLLRTSITVCTVDENTFSAPFGIFYVRTEI